MVIATRQYTKHDPLTVSDSTALDLTLDGQALTMAVQPDGVDTTQLADDAITPDQLHPHTFAGSGTAGTAAHSDHMHSGFALASHTHDDRYYTESETTTLLAGRADSTHTHDDRYYTETESDARFQQFGAIPYVAWSRFSTVSISTAATVLVSTPVAIENVSGFASYTFCPLTLSGLVTSSAAGATLTFALYQTYTPPSTVTGLLASAQLTNLTGNADAFTIPLVFTTQPTDDELFLWLNFSGTVTGTVAMLAMTGTGKGVA